MYRGFPAWRSEGRDRSPLTSCHWNPILPLVMRGGSGNCDDDDDDDENDEDDENDDDEEDRDDDDKNEEK